MEPALVSLTQTTLPNGGVIAQLTIERRQALNALNHEVLTTLAGHLQALSKDAALRVVVICGAGEKAFVAGADIASMANLDARGIAEYVELGQRTMRAIELLRVPVIARVQGFALGGGLELALACDHIIASTSAKFGQPEVNLGVIPGFGGTQRLIHRCGIGAARRLVFGGEIIAAEEAYRLGLVDKLVDAAELDNAVRLFAENIASKAPLAVAGAKAVMREALDSQLLPGLKLEIAEFEELFGSADRREGMQAFIEKRAAKFSAT